MEVLAAAADEAALQRAANNNVAEMRSERRWSEEQQLCVVLEIFPIIIETL